MIQHTCDINNILIQPYLSDTVVWFQTTAMKHWCCDSVTKSCPNLCDPMNCSMPLQSPRVCSNPCPSSQYYLTISSSVIPFSFCCQSSPASGSFPMSQIAIRWPKYWSFSFSISPSNEYSGLIYFRLTGLISSLSKGLSKVFSSTTIQQSQFFRAQTCLWPSSHIHTGLLEKSKSLTTGTFVG